MQLPAPTLAANLPKCPTPLSGDSGRESRDDLPATGNDLTLGINLVKNRFDGKKTFPQSNSIGHSGAYARAGDPGESLG
jgi:hypothetical protein